MVTDVDEIGGLPEKSTTPPEVQELIDLVNTGHLGGQQIMNSLQTQETDNVDATHPLPMKIYIPPETSLLIATLNFTLEDFRAYSSTTQSGGTVTSDAGGSGTSNSGGGGTSGAENEAITVQNAVTDDAGGHNHGLTDHDHSNANNTSQGSAISDHQHGYSHWYLDDHTHNVPNHSHTIDDHSHSIASHTHGVDFAITTSTPATDVTVTINGIDRTSELGGGSGFTADQNDLDITQYLNVNQWNTIDLGSSQLGRINANIFIQALMSQK